MQFLRVGAICVLLLGCSGAFSAPPPPLSPATPDSNNVGTLSLSSVPPNADVFVDGKLMGRTPVHLPGVPTGLRTLRLVRPGFCDYIDSLNVLEGLENDISIDLDSACTLSITSTPESAAVYVDHVLAGSSPVTLTGRTGWTHVKVVKPGNSAWEKNVYLRPGVTVTVAAELKSTLARLSLDVASNDIDVVIDGERLGAGPLLNHPLSAGWHDIGARKHAGMDSLSERVYFYAGESTRWEARFDAPSRAAFFWSLPCPGLGQVMTGSATKGMLMMAGFVAAGIFTFVQHSRYESALSDFDDAHAQYSKLTSEYQAFAAGEALSTQRYEEMKTAYHLRTVGLLVTAAVYMVSIVDALLIHSTVNTLTLADADRAGVSYPDLAFTGDGGKLTMRIRF